MGSRAPNGCGTGNHRYRRPRRQRIAEYCGIFAEKTGRIGRNVGNFIRTHRLMPNRREAENSNDQRPTVLRNGDVFSRDFRRENRLVRSKYTSNRGPTDETSFQTYPGALCHPSDRYINENRTSNEELGTHVIEEYHRNIDVREYRRIQDTRMESHAIMRLDRVEYGRRNSSAKKSRKKRNDEFDESRNSGNFEGQRLYTSLPSRNGRSRNWPNGYSADPTVDPRSLSLYPRSMQDLTDLDIERILERDTNFHVPLSSFRSRDSLVERYRRNYDNHEDDGDDNNLTLYKSLSSGVESGKREKLYVPGRVHYEREYRIYGKDTVALIYYKTCYL